MLQIKNKFFTPHARHLNYYSASNYAQVHQKENTVCWYTRIKSFQIKSPKPCSSSTNTPVRTFISVMKTLVFTVKKKNKQQNNSSWSKQGTSEPEVKCFQCTSKCFLYSPQAYLSVGKETHPHRDRHLLLLADSRCSINLFFWH